MCQLHYKLSSTSTFVINGHDHLLLLKFHGWRLDADEIRRRHDIVVARVSKKPVRGVEVEDRDAVAVLVGGDQVAAAVVECEVAWSASSSVAPSHASQAAVVLVEDAEHRDRVVACTSTRTRLAGIHTHAFFNVFSRFSRLSCESEQTSIGDQNKATGGVDADAAARVVHRREAFRHR